MNGNGHMEDSIVKIRRNPEPNDDFKVKLSVKFLVTSLLACCLLAFSLGRAARLALLQRSIKHEVSRQRGATLPVFLTDGKVPQSSYYSQNLDTSKSSSSSSWLAINRDKPIPTNDGCDDDSDSNFTEAVAEHVMVDIKHVDSSFLNSEHLLAHAMLEVVKEANLMLLSYHCHGMEPTGVSCVGVLRQNYISFHTWPQEGVITLDVCVGGSFASSSLVSAIPTIERVFGVQSRYSTEKPEMWWARKVRGFPQHSAPTDLYTYLISSLAAKVKDRVASVETEYQKIDVYDYAKGKNALAFQSNDAMQSSDALAAHRPQRMVFLDGWVQSTLFHEAAYHEALVHPAMFSHPKPKKVAIIGGGEGATLREVLKHNTVKEAIMIEIDEMMVTASREFLPEWSDCSDLVGSSDWCRDDPRARMYYEDAYAWFINRYAQDLNKESLDVIIMDALDPESEVPFAEALYDNIAFMKSFYDSLSKSGVLVMQLGQSPNVRDPDETLSKHKNRSKVMRLLEDVGFKSIHTYEEGHCGFGDAWSFVVAFKSYIARQRWFRNSAEVDLEILKRVKRTKTGKSPLLYFDGATMQSYQEPPRGIETVFCRRNPTPRECLDPKLLYNPELQSVAVSAFEVKVSGTAEKAGRGVYAKADIPLRTYIAPYETTRNLRVYPSTYKIIVDLYEEGPVESLLESMGITGETEAYKEYECLYFYLHAYGFTNRKHGAREVTVDSSIITFVNHGCRGTYNVGVETEIDEFSADPDEPEEALDGRSHAGTSIFNPVIDRHLLMVGDMNIKDIKAGDEILDNYIAFVGSIEEWEEDIEDLQAMCTGEIIEGSVTDYEEYYGSMSGEI